MLARTLGRVLAHTLGQALEHTLGLALVRIQELLVLAHKQVQARMRAGTLGRARTQEQVRMQVRVHMRAQVRKQAPLDQQELQQGQAGPHTPRGRHGSAMSRRQPQRAHHNGPRARSARRKAHALHLARLGL